MPGGKRLRPMLVLLSAPGPLATGAHHELAAVEEFIHGDTAARRRSRSDLRRRKTANAMFGNAASVLVIMIFHLRAFQMMVRVGGMRVQ